MILAFAFNSCISFSPIPQIYSITIRITKFILKKYLDCITSPYYICRMAAMILTPTRLPQEVLVKLKKAVDKNQFPNRNAAIVAILKKYFKVK